MIGLRYEMAGLDVLLMYNYPQFKWSYFCATPILAFLTLNKTLTHE